MAAATFPWGSFRKQLVQIFLLIVCRDSPQYNSSIYLILAYINKYIYTFFCLFVYFALEKRMLLKSPVKCLSDLYKKNYFQNILCYSETTPVKTFR